MAFEPPKGIAESFPVPRVTPGYLQLDETKQFELVRDVIDPSLFHSGLEVISVRKNLLELALAGWSLDRARERGRKSIYVNKEKIDPEIMIFPDGYLDGDLIREFFWEEVYRMLGLNSDRMFICCKETAHEGHIKHGILDDVYANLSEEQLDKVSQAYELIKEDKKLLRRIYYASKGSRVFNLCRDGYADSFISLYLGEGSYNNGRGILLPYESTAIELVRKILPPEFKEKMREVGYHFD